MTQALDLIPADRRDTAQAALAAAFGTAPVTIAPVTGGASGALTYRVEANARPYLLRIEGAHRSPMRNPHQYTCMQIASDAGIAPPVRHVDDNAGVVIMDFLPTRPLDDFPGGPVALARATGDLIARLQATPTFPQFVDYFAILARMLAFIRGTNMFTPGLLDPHVEGFERIRAAYPKDIAPVSAHNDPNPRNMLFDGTRLWLVDWETAYRNDPLVDVAILLDQLETTRETEDVLLGSWLNRPLDAGLRARLALMRPVTRLYYAGLSLAMFAAVPRDKPDADLSAPTPAEFRHAFAEGRLAATGPQTLYTLGKMQLAGFLAGIATPQFKEALATFGG
jgi:Ser/Thr protein kinase RdoA (MazF antagonist)